MRKTVVWWSVNDQAWILEDAKNRITTNDEGLEKHLAAQRIQTEQANLRTLHQKLEYLRTQFWNKRFRWDGERIIEVEE